MESTLEDVQQELLQMFHSDTILLGHSLESDLRAMKVIEVYCVENSIIGGGVYNILAMWFL